MRRFALIVLAAAMLVSCRQKKVEDFQPVSFPMTAVPAMVSDREEKLEYVAAHYWDDFMDSCGKLPCTPELVNGVRKADVEQAFADYLFILDAVPPADAEKSVSALFGRIESCEKSDTSSNVFETIAEFAEKYLYDPNSPARNEDLYLPFVSGMAASSLVPEEKKTAYAHDAKMCSLNRTGTKAADFIFSDKYGKSYSLYGIKAEYALLFFSNPGCQACKEIIDVLANEPEISGLVKDGRLAVLNIYIDSDLKEWYEYMSIYPEEWYNGYDPNSIIRDDVLYNVRAIPSLYLLDADKKVILKDAPQEKVFAYLSAI